MSWYERPWAQLHKIRDIGIMKDDTFVKYQDQFDLSSMFHRSINGFKFFMSVDNFGAWNLSAIIVTVQNDVALCRKMLCHRAEVR